MMARSDPTMRALDWAAARVAEAIVARAGKRMSRRARAAVMHRVRAAEVKPSLPDLRRRRQGQAFWENSQKAGPPRTVEPCRTSLWRRPFLGTELTCGGAIATFATGPVVWFVVDLAWAALPA